MKINDTTDINSEVIFEELQLRREVDTFGNIRYYNKDNQLHRTTGPAIIWNDDGSKWFAINGCGYSRENFLKEVERLKNEKLAEI